MCADESNNFSCSGGSRTVSVWWRPGSFAGFETTMAGWNLLGSETVTSAGFDLPTPLHIGGLTLAPGETVGIAMSNARWLYTNGNGANQTHNNGELELRAGSANNVAFSPPVFSPRVWNGTVYYALRQRAPSMSGSVTVLVALVLLAAGVFRLRVRRSAV
jgi:hypothetical protein